MLSYFASNAARHRRLKGGHLTLVLVLGKGGRKNCSSGAWKVLAAPAQELPRVRSIESKAVVTVWVSSALARLAWCVERRLSYGDYLFFDGILFLRPLSRLWSSLRSRQPCRLMLRRKILNKGIRI